MNPLTWLQSLVSNISSLVLLDSEPTPGDSLDLPLEVEAVPGLMTLLDVTLFRSVEGQLTGTLCSSHALLLTWLDIKQQATLVLQQIKMLQELQQQQKQKHHVAVVMVESQLIAMSRQMQVENFARACLDSACMAIEVLTVDKLAQSANLSDPYDNSSTDGGGGWGSGTNPMSSNPSNLYSSTHHQGGGGGGGGGGAGDFVNSAQFVQLLQQASTDTGRHGRPLSQRPRDCWESPRLHCPDYVWADDACLTSQKCLRYLMKQYNLSIHAAAYNSTTNMIMATPTVSATMSQLERQTSLLFRLVHNDLPLQLIPFRAAVEAESVVLKRLYLVKCEYRAPFRAFLEAHYSVLKAPSLELVDEYLRINSKSKLMKRRSAAKDKFQQLIEKPSPLVEALSLEQACEEYEIDMAKALFPFCELARFLDYKRARLKWSSTIGILSHPAELARLQDRLLRLKGCLYRPKASAVADTTLSTGIRPLLLDLQGVPRDEEEIIQDETGDTLLSNVNKQTLSWLEKQQQKLERKCKEKPTDAGDNSLGNENDGNDEKKEAESSTNSTVIGDGFVPTTQEGRERILDVFIHDLEILVKLCEARNSFLVDVTKKNMSSELDVPHAIVRSLSDFDGELFRCQYLDWYDLVVRQDEIVGQHDFEQLAEELRYAELQMSLAAAPTESLEMVRERVELMAQDRSKRYLVLKEMIEEVCRREMNLYVTIQEPPQDQTLLLKPTSALGVFGLPLAMSGETLPIG